MKRLLTTGIMVVFAVSLLATTQMRPVSADAPTVALVSPASGSTIIAPSFPHQVPLTFSVGHAGGLNQVSHVDVTIGGTSILTGVGANGVADPWTPTPACNLANLNPAGFTGCSVVDNNNGTLTVPWTVNAPGTFTVVVSAKHGAEGSDTEAFEVIGDVTVEYPAPPAIANAYIKAQGYKLVAKRHGCVLSSIATQHAQYSAFGPKGGPYCKDNTDASCTKAVHSEVEFLMATSCP